MTVYMKESGKIMRLNYYHYKQNVQSIIHKRMHRVNELRKCISDYMDWYASATRFNSSNCCSNKAMSLSIDFSVALFEIQV